MKRMTISLLVFTLAIVPFGLLHAQNASPDPAYAACIDRKIDRCQRQAATMINSGSEYLQRYSESARREADFYREHRTELASDLAAKGIGTKQHQVDSFLETAFQAAIVVPEKTHLAGQ
jgi:hypothetical protein